jgi:Zinc finger, C3HC4 type (RING finger)
MANPYETLGSYSAADFPDADDARPLAAVFDIGGNGNPEPYTTAANGIVQKHLDEIKQKVAASLTMPSGWKARLREFMSKKNTELMDFLNISVASHPSIGRGETILRRFGNLTINAKHSSIRDLVLDLSGADRVAEIENILVSMKTDNSLMNFTECIRFVYEKYREAGEEALKQEGILKSRLAVLDRMQGKVVALLELDPTNAYKPLMEASEAYLGTVFDKNQIREAYEALIEAYRRFLSVRDIVLMMRAVQSNENEPLCSICLEEVVTYCISPCGHTYCATCMRRQSGVCFMCRTPIKDKIKLYFG